ncbi:hypothetical protein [Polyangium sp. y55x31]|uniref:hypothetical protein n=1 Tax=Polyangium sp. y55x31 TaxID=3042688 RepID=UPI0024826718|nr:hypothetical protein [Polyangium sp. y55x31]MDI1476509.1 hypothetical protein [Polyangium sp. y55x31]
MSTSTIAAFAILVLASSCATSTPEPELPPTAAPAQNAPSAAAQDAPSAAAQETPSAAEQDGSSGAPVLDLGTPEKARATIYDVLRRGDKEAFKKCVSKRILERQAAQFDTWYAAWKTAADNGPPEKFKKIEVKQEDGVYKLDEN